jgi:hypothetical protein
MKTRTKLYSCLTFGLLAAVTLASTPSAIAYEEYQLVELCGSYIKVGRSSSAKSWRDAEKDVNASNAKVRACRNKYINMEARRQQLESVPIGEAIPGATVNGQPLYKCSHGDACLGQLMRAMQQGFR